jgi:hypothetical protein
MEVESGGNCNARGASGENGCLQFMPATWKMWSRDVLGYVPPMTKVNELYVAMHKIQGWLDMGYTAEQCALMWNSGGTVHKRGVNRWGVSYDTYAYARAVLAQL